MQLKLALAAATLVAVLGAGPDAHADPAWHLGTAVGNTNNYCLGNGITARAGYYGELTPATGDNPDSALVITVTAGCGPVTVAPSFVLPAGVLQDTSQNVECYRKRGDKIVGPVNGCGTAPIANNWNVANVYGWSRLDAGETLEVYMPIAYVRRTPRTSFTGIVYNDFGPISSTVTFEIAYAARFANYSAASSANGLEATMSFKLDHFHEVGQVYIDYGTTVTATASAVTVNFTSSSGPLSTDAQYTYYPTFAMTVSGLQPGTFYYWRPRIVTPFGTFLGETQWFTTNAQILTTPPGPFYCRWRTGC